ARLHFRLRDATGDVSGRQSCPHPPFTEAGWSRPRVLSQGRVRSLSTTYTVRPRRAAARQVAHAAPHGAAAPAASGTAAVKASTLVQGDGGALAGGVTV